MTRYGVRWYAGIGEHDYEETGFSEYDTLLALFSGLISQVGDEPLFRALVDGRQDTIYWVTDDFGFELYWPR